MQSELVEIDDGQKREATRLAGQYMGWLSGRRLVLFRSPTTAFVTVNPDTS
jgi:hypothetical protein